MPVLADAPPPPARRASLPPQHLGGHQLLARPAPTSKVQNNVTAFWPDDSFRYIVVGNEVISESLAQFILPAMRNVVTALAAAGLQGQIKNCKELLDYAIGELRNSVDKFSNLEVAKMDDIVDDLKVWLSAAVTYQETCLDGFQNTSGDAAASMTKALNSSSMLTSNTLAIVDQMSTVLTSFQLPSLSRRLLAENEVSDRREFPEWFHHERRRLLALSPQEMKPDATVAQDGSGNYKTISEAIAAAPEKSNKTSSGEGHIGCIAVLTVLPIRFIPAKQNAKLHSSLFRMSHDGEELDGERGNLGSWIRRQHLVHAEEQFDVIDFQGEEEEEEEEEEEDDDDDDDEACK
ncbi:hypothetical protein Cni_G19102 [Canna indica]|uniref:Pectinesterase inhibitor domain-containing protein n=1 Tax=Canna indica TaxID=4628 RepID=A0AAQ3KK89_9LILI|nr:hypothetical protein Cni_G19102 [Canna indica]